MRKRLRLKKMVSALLAVAMIGQSCLVTTAGDLTDDAAIVAMQEQAAAEEAAARKAAEEKAAQEAAAAQKAAEEAAAQKAAQEAAAAQKAAEEAAAAQKAAEEAAAAQKAAEEAAAQKAAEEAAAQEAAAAQKAAEEAAAQKAAEEAAAQEAAAAQKAAEEAAAQKAAEEAAAQKAAEEAAAQEAAEEAAAQEAAEEAAAQEAAAAQKAAEEAAAQKAAEEAAAQEAAAAQKAAEEAAAQKAAEEAAAQKAAEEAAAQKAAEEKAAQEITYRVTFEAHATDYGSIYVRGESGPIASVSSYYKEVKENGSFAFTIHANDGYEVEHVRYADTNAELPKNAQGAYEIAAVTRNVKVVVTYKIIPQETADAAVETEADEGQTEAPTDESETEEDREAETEVGTENAAEESTEAESEYETEPGTEAESETESESEKEIAMPEFHYNGVCNGIAVAIRAPEGVFPEGTKAVLAAPSAESLAAAAAASGQDASDLMGVDITFRYDGKEIQPTSAVEVSFRAAEIADADISNVYHVSDGGAVQEVTASKSGASLGFTADSFSTWIFPTAGGAVAPASILNPETSIATYVFKADGETVDTQYITSGDTLSEPAAPVKEGHRFIGWYVGETPVTFGTVSTVSETEEIIVEARFEEVYYVFFHNPEGAVVATKEGIAGAKITTSDVTFAVGAEESITGWYYSGSAVESVTLSDSNVDLYAKVEKGFWVTYDSDGGSYVAPEFYPAGETAALSAQPTKNGYSFEGWYDGDARVNSTTMSVSVKAKWKENSSADYRVIYWQQKVTDDKNATDAQKTYAYVATETKAGRPGTTVNASSITKSYNGFTKNTVNSKSVMIAADGSTIMNVYYDRVLCTVNYYVSSGYYWSSWEIKKTVTGLYGANLKEGEWWTDYYWYQGSESGNGCVLLTSYDFKAAGYGNNEGNETKHGIVTVCNFYAGNPSRDNYISYYNEQADGSFKLVQELVVDRSGLTIYEKYAGYELYKYTTSVKGKDPTTAAFWASVSGNCVEGQTKNGKSHHIASKLKMYKLDYSNGGEVQHHETVKYTASLNGYDAKFTPTTKPATVDANYTFDGWYSDPECTKRFDFNTTMPATNIVVYAGWKAPEVRVTAHRSPEDMPGVNVEAAYGESVDEHLLPAISYDAETQEFLGWFTRNADGSYRPWDFSTKIYSDVDLYARVISKGTFKVSYVANGGTGTVEDGRAYAQGAKADVKAITGITAPTGKTFLYWSLNAEGSGKKYYPNNTIEIEEDITLYAIWGDTTTTSLTYDGNGGATSDGKAEVVVSGLKNNQKVKAEGEIFARTGYKFIGWSTKSDATAAKYAAGADVIVHADETVNVLYAVWEIRNDYQYTVHYYWNGTEEKAAGDKVVPNQTYNETITESPIAIGGYTPVNSGSQKMVIDAENKTLTFYYYKNVGLTANSDTKVYNGQEQSVSGFTGAPEGADFSAIHVGAKGTDAGEYPAAFAEGTIGTIDKTKKYIVTGTTNGKLSITPVTEEVVVTIEGNHDSKVYDGTEHKVTGYKVTGISNVLYTKDNFSFSGNAEAKRTAVGTTYMGLTAEDFTNKSANFSNVTFEVTDGYMEITPAGDAVVVTIEGNHDSAVYDGAEHGVTGYTVVSISNELYAGSDFSFSGTAEAKRTEAGTTYMGLTAEHFKNKNENFSKVTFNVTDGYMEITPVTEEVVVTIEGNHDSKVYDGTEHKVTGYKVTEISNALYTKDNFSFSGTAEAKRTEAGTTMMGLTAEDFANKSENFNNVTFKVTDGYMEITPVTEEVVVTIVGNHDSKVYDGTEHKVTGYKVTEISNALYKKDNFSFSGTAEAKRTEAGTTMMGLTAEDFANKSENFNNVTFKVTDGYMEITPVTEEVVVTIEGNHDSKVYDGTEHKVTGYKVTEISNALYTKDNFSFSGTAEAKRTEAGTTMMGLTAEDFANKSENFNNVTFKVTDGYMEITPVTEEVVVTIVGNHDSKVYDGTEHKVTGYKVTEISNALYTKDNFSFSGTAEAKRTEAGTTMMGLTAEDFANKSENFSNVTFKVTDGYMEITPVTDEVVVTIEGNHDSKVYDGTEHKVTGYKVTEISNALYTKDNFSFSGTAEAKRTEAGTTMMGLTAEDFANKSENFNNVTFKVTDGYMEITPVTEEVVVTIEGKHDSKVYDGTEHKVTGYKVTEISNALYTKDNFSFSGTAEAKRTEAGTTMMGLTAEDFANKSENFSNVTFKVTDGYMEITPVTDEVVVTIEGNHDSKVYDGTEHKVTGYKVTEISNALYTKDNFSFSGTAEAKRTEAGTTMMGLKAEDFANKSANFVKVTFEVTDGYMEITPVTEEVVVTIEGNHDSKVYDGEEHKVTGYKVTEISNALYTKDNFSFSGTAEAKRTEAGTTMMGLKAENFANKSENFSNVTFKVTDGYMEITPVTEEVVVTIEGNHDSKVYDGTEHKVTGYKVTGISNVLYTKDNFSFSGNAEAKRTAVGTTYMGLTAEDFTNKSANFSNVTFEVTDGYMEITPAGDAVVVTIEGNHDSAVYDGAEHGVTGYTVVSISNELYAGSDFSFSGTAEAKRTEAGTTYMGLTEEHFKNKNENFSKVTFNVTDGYMEITPATEEVVVTIEGNHDSKVYDGTEHKVTGYKVTGISNVLYTKDNFSFSGTAEAKRTEAGTTMMGLTAEDFANKSENFNNVTFKVTDGYMEITPVTEEVVVTIEGNHDSKVYDGTEHKVTGYKVTEISNALYTKDNFSFSGTAEAKRTEAGTTMMGLTAEDFANKSENFNNVTFKVTDGYMEITPVTEEVVVTIVGNHDSKVYDGTEHKVTGYKVTEISNALYTKDNFSFSGTAEAKRTEAGTTMMGLTAEDFANKSENFSNVTFKVTDGYMEITPVTDEVVVTIEGNHDSKVYDGTEHKVTGYKVTEISNALYTKDNFSFSGTAEAKRTEAGTTMMGLTAEDFANKSENFNNVTFKVTDGYMEITPVTEEVVVTIEGKHDSKVYDGTEHKVTGYKVTEISNALYTKDNFSFSGTAEAKRTEAGTTMMGLTAEDFANKSENFSNVTFKVTDGYMEITPVTDEVVVTIEGNHDSKVYDGTEHKVTGYKVTEISNALYTKDNFSFSGTAEAKRTEAGTTMMGLTAEDFANKSENFSNVTFKVTDGYMEITPVTDEVVVTIEGNHDSTVYDGTEHEVTGYDVAISNPLYTEGDFTFSGTAEVAGTNADTYEMGLSVDDFTNTSGNFANVRFDVTDGFLKITKREVEFTANSASKAYDGKALTDNGYTLTGGSLAENQNETVTVVGSQTLVGSSDNEITEVRIVAGGALGEDVTDNYAITTIKGILTVTDGIENDPVDPGKVVTKTHEDAAYDLGETVTFTISVTNIYDTAKTITITELPGVAIEGADASKPNVLVVTDVPAGETITATATYTITWQDIANGRFVNTVKAEFSDGKPFETTDTVTVVDPVYDYTMEKTAKVPEHESGMVKEGETIGYTIRVQNTGNQPLEEIRLTDTLNAAGMIANIRGAEYVQDGKVTIFTIKDLQPKQTITITYEYVVLNADKGKTISNAVVGPNPDPEKPGKEGDTETTVEDPKLEVNKEVKAITAADGTEKDVTAEAALNDIITYKVTVKNTGNVVLTDVHVADSLEDIKLAEGQSFEFRKLEAGETQTITYTYQVQEKDLGLMIVNKATATAKVPEDPEDKPQPKDEDEKEVPTEDRNPSLKVEKEVTSKAAAEDGRYIAGETITYKVTVTNNGNLTLKDVVLKDVLTRADGTTILPDGWESDGQKIGEMVPGATRVFEYSHKVTEEDLGGVLKNAATASGEPKLPKPDPEKPEPKPEGEDEKEVPTEDRKPSLKAEKKVTSKPAAEDGKYTVGETITYEVTVMNTGNLTLKNIHVQDIMTRPDGTQMIPSGLTNQVQTIEGLEPNASKTLQYTHVVTEQDLGGELKNAVTVSGEPSVPKPNPDPDPEKPEPKPEDKTEETVITEDPTNCSIIVTKKLTNMMDEALVLDNAVFYVALFTDEGLTNRIGEVRKLTFGANQSTATTVFAKIRRGIYYVAETDENGKIITSGAYNNGAFVAQYAAGQKVEIKENGTAAEFAFANQFLVLPSEYDLSKRVTIVKSVQTKKGKELKTNETFYAGIFSDAAHTQLAENVDQNIVPLATNGTAGARNEIEVTFAPGASTTLYIAEVSADGVPVEQNAAFEYTASIDQNVITLSEDTDDVTVKITNTSKKDEPETECEDNRQSESNKPKAAANSVKTGDDTPLMTFVLLLLCSASCMMLLAGRRKKEDGQDR